MWSEEYQKLNTSEKAEFRRIANYLLSHTYLVRYQYNASKKMTLPNGDYQTASRLIKLLQDYFHISGWRLEKDDNYGVMALENIYDHNRLRIDRFTTLFLYVCRLIYEEQREQANSFHVVATSTSEVTEKMRVLGLLKKNKGKTNEQDGKTTQKERLDAQRTLAHHNIIQKMESTWSGEGNQIFILPSILSIVSNQGINDMMKELEELRTDDSAGEVAAEPETNNDVNDNTNNNSNDEEQNL